MPRKLFRFTSAVGCDSHSLTRTILPVSGDNVKQGYEPMVMSENLRAHTMKGILEKDVICV